MWVLFLQATTTVYVTIVDENDNAPVFQQQHYEVTLDEGPDTLNATLITIQALDRDEGPNGTVTYAITEGNILDTFHIDSTTVSRDALAWHFHPVSLVSLVSFLPAELFALLSHFRGRSILWRSWTMRSAMGATPWLSLPRTSAQSHHVVSHPPQRYGTAVRATVHNYKSQLSRGFEKLERIMLAVLELLFTPEVPLYEKSFISPYCSMQVVLYVTEVILDTMWFLQETREYIYLLVASLW